MKTAEELPTVFARNLGEKAGLLLPLKKGVDHQERAELTEKMQWFQQMAVTSSFEECILIYFGTELSDEQLQVLRLIHKTTKPWITGHIVGVLMSRLENDRTANKDFAEAVRVLVEQTTQTENGETGGKMQGILIKSTQTEKLASVK